MINERTVNTRFTADGSEVNRELDDLIGRFNQAESAAHNLGKEAGALADKVGGSAESFGFLGKALGTIGTVAAGAVTGFVALGAAIVTNLGVAIKAAADEEVSIMHLKAAVEATGQSWAEASVPLEKAADAMMGLGVSDEKTRDVLAQLTMQTGNYEKALSLLGISMDLARGRGMDLSSAAMIVGRVAEGNTGILRRYGIQVGENATAVEALTLLQERYAGQSEAYSNTFSGAMSSITTGLADLWDVVGQPFLPKLTELAQGFATSLQEGGFLYNKARELAAFFEANLPAAVQVTINALVNLVTAVAMAGEIIKNLPELTQIVLDESYNQLNNLSNNIFDWLNRTSNNLKETSTFWGSLWADEMPRAAAEMADKTGKQASILQNKLAELGATARMVAAAVMSAFGVEEQEQWVTEEYEHELYPGGPKVKGYRQVKKKVMAPVAPSSNYTPPDFNPDYFTGASDAAGAAAHTAKEATQKVMVDMVKEMAEAIAAGKQAIIDLLGFELPQGWLEGAARFETFAVEIGNRFHAAFVRLGDKFKGATETAGPIKAMSEAISAMSNALLDMNKAMDFATSKGFERKVDRYFVSIDKVFNRAFQYLQVVRRYIAADILKQTAETAEQMAKVFGLLGVSFDNIKPIRSDFDQWLDRYFEVMAEMFDRTREFVTGSTADMDALELETLSKRAGLIQTLFDAITVDFSDMVLPADISGRMNRYFAGLSDALSMATSWMPTIGQRYSELASAAETAGIPAGAITLNYYGSGNSNDRLDFERIANGLIVNYGRGSY